MTTPNSCKAYSCGPITSRTIWQAAKNANQVYDTAEACGTACFPLNKWVCYNDGSTPPLQITSVEQWNTVKPTLPATATLVEDPTKCAVPKLNSWYCTGATPSDGVTPWDCGQIKTLDDFYKYKAYISDTATNCDDCYPKEGTWCDKTTFTCNTFSSRQDYLTNKDKALPCGQCYPGYPDNNKSYCLDDYSDCLTIRSEDDWKNAKAKGPGKVIEDCETQCFPQGKFYCNQQAKCAEVESYSQYKKAPRPFYKTSDCNGKCTSSNGDKKGGSLLWLWILLVILLIIAIIVGIYFYMRNKKKKEGMGGRSMKYGW